MKKNQEFYRRERYQRIPSTSRYQIRFNHCEGNNIREYRDQPRHEFRKTTSQRRSFTPRYESFFYGHCFIFTNCGHKAADFKAYGRNGQVRNAYVTPYHIECYKCHNYEHIAHDCRSMMDTSMKENIDIIYKKVWKRKQEQVKEEQMNEGHPKVILSGLAIVRDQDKSTGKKEDVRYSKVWRRNEKQEEHVNEDHVPEIVLTGFAVVQDHDESTGKEEEVRIKKEDEKEDVSTDEDGYYSASEWILF
jgi:hypothetical protein